MPRGSSTFQTLTMPARRSYSKATMASYGVVLDREGGALPSDCGWKFCRSFPLGVHEPGPEPIDPEPILRGLELPDTLHGEGANGALRDQSMSRQAMRTYCSSPANASLYAPILGRA